jgi:hypothetical protein
MSDDSPDETPESQQGTGTNLAESDESIPDKDKPYVDQEMADEYGFTPQQAKAMGMFL